MLSVNLVSYRYPTHFAAATAAVDGTSSLLIGGQADGRVRAERARAQDAHPRDCEDGMVCTRERAGAHLLRMTRGRWCLLQRGTSTTHESSCRMTADECGSRVEEKRVEVRENTDLASIDLAETTGGGGGNGGSGVGGVDDRAAITLTPDEISSFHMTEEPSSSGGGGNTGGGGARPFHQPGGEHMLVQRALSVLRGAPLAHQRRGYDEPSMPSAVDGGGGTRT